MILDVSARKLVDGDKEVVLQRLQCRMIKVLSAAGPGYVSDKTMHAAMWPRNGTPSDPYAVLRVTASTLNWRIFSAGMKPLVDRVWGVGFRLLQTVSVTGDKPVVVVPDELQGLLRELLTSHPDKARAAQMLQVLG